VEGVAEVVFVTMVTLSAQVLATLGACVPDPLDFSHRTSGTLNIIVDNTCNTFTTSDILAITGR